MNKEHQGGAPTKDRKTDKELEGVQNETASEVSPEADSADEGMSDKQ